MRILVGAAPPWARTGYGVQAEALVKRLQADGHEVGWVPLGAYGGGYWDEGTYKFFPQAPDDFYANETIIAHARAFEADIVISLIDAWTLTSWGGAEFRWVPWVPVDGTPVSHTITENLPKAWRILAMSEYGQKQLDAAGFDSTLMPLGFESSVYYPEASGRTFREQHGIPADAFLFGTVGMNLFPDRKGFDRLLEAFARFQQGKENVYLYMHTSPLPNKSFDLNKLCDFFGLGQNVRFPRPYPLLLGYSNEAMRAMYNALDCFVLATRGEGFGVPLVEAMACGVPVIATDCTSVPEIVTDAVQGDLVKVKDRFLNLGYYYWSNVDIDDLVRAMEEMYLEHEITVGAPGVPAGVYRAARFPNLKQICEKSARRFEWDIVYNTYWRPFLADCEDEIKSRIQMAGDSRSAAVVEDMGEYVRKTAGPLSDVKKEYDLLKTLKHANIISPDEGDYDKWGRFYMELPRYPRSLDQLDCSTLTDEQRQAIIEGVASALTYLHNLGWAHRDVHPSNVLLTEDLRPILIDFTWAELCQADVCVDFRPWLVPEKAVPSVQNGQDQRGFHTIVAYVRGVELDEARATGLPGVPYQQLDGAGERDCDLRWELMEPDVAGKTVLDVGCNLGYFAGRSLKEGARNAIGIDKDEPTIEAARQLYPDVVFAVRDLATNGHFEEYDVGFCLSVLQHLPKPQDTLDALRSACKTLYVEVPDGVVDLSGAEELGRSERNRPLVVFRD